MIRVIGLDLGGTFVKAGIADLHGRVSGAVAIPSGEAHGRDAWLASGREALARVMEVALEPVAAVGLAVPGAVESKRRVLVDLAARLATGGGIDLSAAFAPSGVPVAADNDARASLEAERRWGAAAGVDDVVMFTLGTGLGGAAVVGGHSPAGEPVLGGIQLGHLTVDLDGGECVCGNRGCAELYASATGIVRLAREAGLEVDDARAVFEDASPGAEAVIGRFTVAFGSAVVNAVHAHQPSLVVVAGGVVGSAERWLPGVQEYVDRHAWTMPGRRVEIVPSGLRGDFGILAGAAVALRDVGVQ